MPGEHVDKIVEELVADLNYVAPKGEALEKLSEEEKKVMSEKLKADYGTTLFQRIESSDLTPEEKQEVYQRAVKQAVDHQVKTSSDPTTLLRGNSTTARFMTEYMNANAQEYLESVYDVALMEASKIKLPDSISGKPVGSNAFDDIKGVSKEDLAKLHDGYLQVAKKTLEASEKNLSMLSPNARKFLQSAFGDLENDKALNMAAASTLLLRGASPYIASAGALLREEKETMDVGNLLMGSNMTLQTYANSLNRKTELAPGKALNDTVNKLRSEESLSQTGSAYKALSKGSEKLDEFTHNLKVEVEVPSKEMTEKVEGLKSAVGRLDEARLQKAAQDQIKFQRRQQGVGAFDDRVKELEARKTQLSEKPTAMDKIKCFFKHGLKGVGGEIEKIDQKIGATKVAAEQILSGVSLESAKQHLTDLKYDQAALNHAMGLAENVVRLDNIAKSVNQDSPVTEKQMEEAFVKHETLKPLKEEVTVKIKEQEKVISVREKLGAKAQKQEEPKQGKSIGVG